MSEPQYAQGKICYLMLPSEDPQVSSMFYARVFNWNIRSHPNGEASFDDPTGQVSGMWLTDTPASEGGYEVDLWVDDVAATSREIESAGGELIGDLVHISDNEQYQRFRDPDGNVLGIYHHDEE